MKSDTFATDLSKPLKDHFKAGGKGKNFEQKVYMYIQRQNSTAFSLKNKNLKKPVREREETHKEPFCSFSKCLFTGSEHKPIQFLKSPFKTRWR